MDLVKQVKHLQSVIKSNLNRRIKDIISFLIYRKSNVEKSMDYLKQYLDRVSKKEGDNQYAKACGALGLIQTTLVYIYPILFFF